MNQIFDIFNNFLSKPDVFVVGPIVSVISFCITYSMIPRIIMTVEYKNLMDHPNERSSHTAKTPTLAGVAFFASLLISFFFIQGFDISGKDINIITSLVILFFVGLKDDLMVLSSKTKIIFQSVAIFFVLLIPELHIVNLNGFLGIYEIPFWLMISLSYLTILYIINAYNLIDGIDGLAGLLGVLMASIFALFFFIVGIYFYALLALVIIGFLMAFLRYNLSKKNKIFMGDTGSMIVGFLLAILFLRFIALSPEQFLEIGVLPENSILVAVSILFFPVIDVIRVIMVRLINGTGAFSADRRHMHHVFIDKGLPHIKASITFTITNLIAFILIYEMNKLFSSVYLFAIFILFTILTFYILLLLDTNEEARAQRKKLKKYVPEPIYKQEFRIRKSIIIFLKKIFYRNML